MTEISDGYKCSRGREYGAWLVLSSELLPCYLMSYKSPPASVSFLALLAFQGCYIKGSPFSGCSQAAGPSPQGRAAAQHF